MIKVAIVGTGTVSNHLTAVFSTTEGVKVTQVLPSRGEALKAALNAPLSEAQGVQTIAEADIYILAVSDDAIQTVSQQLAKSKKLLVHTSGSVAIQTLPEGTRRGVFYPLQTFSKERKIDFKSVPICVEAEKQEDLTLLKTLANAIADEVHEISSEQRRSLHLAAVFVNNFANHLYQIGNEICEENNVPFAILKPLIMETAAKISSLSPVEAQTGPAKRNDTKTLEKQLNQLNQKTHQEIYQLLTASIKERHL